MIELENITKHFRLAQDVVQVLKGISLSVGEGEFVSIMGPSGSGKSTLSSILGCLATPSAGLYRIDGHDTSQLSSSQMARLRNKKIGFIFQDFNLLDGLTALENVALPLFYAGIGVSERRKRAMECLEKVGLKEKVAHTPNQLSGGQKQRVAIARALINNPSFLFADEPTGALDKKTGHEIMGLLQSLNLMGHTIVQVTHSTHDANYSKRILYLVDGLIIRDEFVERPTIGALASGDSRPDGLEGKLWRVVQSVPTQPESILNEIKGLIKRSPNSESLMEAAKTCAKWDHPELNKLLVELAHNEFWGVRAEVIRACFNRTKPFTLELCSNALKDDAAWVRFLAMVQLKRIWPFDLTEAVKKLIVDCAGDTDERVRATAVSLMGLWKAAEMLPLFLSRANDKDGRVRANAIDGLYLLSLAGTKYPEILNCGVEHLEERNNRARANAAVLVSLWDPSLAVKTLSKMIRADNNLMRASSAWALGLVSHPDSGRLLLERLGSEHEEMVLGQVVRSLGRLALKDLPLQDQINLVLAGGHQSLDSTA